MMTSMMTMLCLLVKTIPCHVWTPQIHYSDQKEQSLNTILCQLNPNDYLNIPYYIVLRTALSKSVEGFRMIYLVVPLGR
jgi:hypothetical protein